MPQTEKGDEAGIATALHLPAGWSAQELAYWAVNLGEVIEGAELFDARVVRA